jgi:hypothetical protein
VSVSPNYLEQLQSRYPNAPALQAGRTMVVPFGAMVRDFPDGSAITNNAPRKIVYVGAGGSIMSKSFARICELISRLDESIFNTLHIDLYGTDTGWEPGKPKTLELIAARYGMEKFVSEYPLYISYSKAIAKISAADGLLILGVDDPAYMPSKLFLYALTGKPLLVCLHARSQANRYFAELPNLGHLIHFECDRNAPDELSLLKKFLDEVRDRTHFDRRILLDPYLSPSLARRHADFFQRCLKHET